MTLCIAAICREENDPRIVFCNDTLSSQGPLGSRNSTTKVDVLGNGWIVQLAGNVPIARNAIDDLRQVFSAANFHATTRNAVLDAVRNTLNPRQLIEPLAGQLLFSGFVRRTPLLIVVTDVAGTLEIGSQETFVAVGEGDLAATILLNYREYKETLPIELALYLIYEAKRIASQVTSVGSLTIIGKQANAEGQFPAKALINFFSPLGLDALDQMFQKLGPQPLPRRISPFPPECFVLPRQTP